jgi:membrane-associated protease RseP (regulator of RpoE activity)
MALVLVFVALVFLGVPDRDSDSRFIAEIQDPSPALDAGLRPGDRILEVDGRDVSDDYLAMREYLQDHPGEEVALLVERDDDELTLRATLDTREVDGEEVGVLGVIGEAERVRRNPFEGAVESVQITGETMWDSLRGLVSIFSPSGIGGYVDNLTSVNDDGDDGGGTVSSEDGNRFISPVGVVRLADSQWQAGAADFVFFLFAINIFIGLFNLVPLLPFDGGHVAIATYERIREIGRGGKRYFADVSKLLPLTYGVVVVLGLIFLSSLFLDLADPLQLQ